MSLSRRWMPSPCYSGRGSGVRLIVVHTAEGARTIESLGGFFANAGNQVSSHTGIDDKAGVIGEYVHRDRKAWTQANANPYSVATELCAFASWSRAEWMTHPVMLANTAAWIAEEAAAFAIPIIKLDARAAQSGARGVCGHVELGASGGGHWDPGPGFPWDHVMSLAAGGAPAPGPTPPPTEPPPPPTEEVPDNMVLNDPRSGGYWVVASREGAIFAYHGAPFLGGTNNPAMNAGNRRCVGIAPRANNDGYTLVLDFGDVTPGAEQFRFYDFPYDGSALK